MRKSAVIYVVSCIAAALCAVGIAFLSFWLLPLLLAVVTWWSIYYFRLRYQLEDDCLVIYSGAVLRSVRIIPLSNILWKTSISFPFSEHSALTVIHTCGGRSVIFGGFSTPS